MSTVNVPIPVPASGFGPAVDVSSLVGEKTVILSGRYQGAYVLYGSHDGANFVPLLIFNAGGIESIKQTFSGALSRVKLKSLVSNANGVSASISGLSVPLDNSFTSIGPVGKGLSGVVDLGNNAYQTDLNFMGFGRLNGAVVVEGSSDGMGFNPIGEFSASPSGSSLLGGGGIEFSPIGTKDKVRFVRLNVLGDVDSFLVTIGGAQSDSGGGGGETLADAYLAGVTSVDQTLVLSDANGGKVVFDASGSGFMGEEAVDILGSPNFGSLCVGSHNLGIGTAGSPPYFLDPSVQLNVAIGPYITVWAGDSSVLVGEATQSWGSLGVSVGYAAQNGVGSVSIGDLSSALASEAVAIGDTSGANAVGTVAIGWGSQSNGVNDVVIGTNNNTDGVGTDNILIASNGSITGVTSGQNIAMGYEPIIIFGSQNILLGTSNLTDVSNGIVMGAGNVIGNGAPYSGLENINVIGQNNTVISPGFLGPGHYISVLGTGTTITTRGYVLALGDFHTFAADTEESATVGWGNQFATGTSGLTFGASISILGGRGIGFGDSITINSTGENLAIGIGSDVTVTDNQCVIGCSSVIQPENAIHEFIVRGYNAGVIDTLKVVDDPASDGLVGLFVTVNRSGTVTSRQVRIGANDSGGSGYALLRVPN